MLLDRPRPLDADSQPVTSPATRPSATPLPDGGDGEALAPARGGAARAVAPLARVGRTLRESPDLALLATLLVLTAVFSRHFSKGIYVGPIYVTELVMALAGLIAIIRLGGVREVWAMLRRLPLPWLALIWVVGAIATVRGLQGYSFDLVSHDIGLVDYTLLLPLVALVVVDRNRYEAMYATLVACGFAGIASFAVHFLSDHAADQVNYLWPLQGAPAGLYMSFAIIWIVARYVNGVRTSYWLLAIVPFGLVLMSLTTQRSVWLVAVAALAVVVVLAPRQLRLRSALGVAALLAVCFVAAIGAEHGVNSAFGDIQENTSDPTAAGGAQLTTELTSVTGSGSSTEGDNVSWRLAYWEELISRMPSDAALGAGFGEPTAFVWNDRKYDFRDGEPGSGIDVAGPHNSFIAFMYRMGIPAFIALLAVLFIAGRNVWRSFRTGFESAAERVMLTTLTAMAVAGATAASFNVALSGPFFSLFFWLPLAMLLLWPAIRRAAAADDGAPAKV